MESSKPCACGTAASGIIHLQPHPRHSVFLSGPVFIPKSMTEYSIYCRRPESGSAPRTLRLRTATCCRYRPPFTLVIPCSHLIPSRPLISPMRNLLEQADLHEVEVVGQALRLLRARGHDGVLEHRGILPAVQPSARVQRNVTSKRTYTASKRKISKLIQSMKTPCDAIRGPLLCNTGTGEWRKPTLLRLCHSILENFSQILHSSIRPA